MRIVVVFAALLALVGLYGCEQTGKSALDLADGGAVAPAFQKRVLPNGLTVVSAPDDGTASVTVQVWYRVGSRHDPAGRSGFAHLFEHLMFKASRNLPDGSIDRLTEDVGGSNNAQTWPDFTSYYSVVPANHLEQMLFAEADRMASLVVDQQALTAERNVVKEELRERILASPYGDLFGLYVTQEGFRGHPYGRPGIGSIDDLDAASLDEVRAFHATFYRPDNAVLIVSGRFDQAALDTLVDRYFASIPRPAEPILAGDPPVPARGGPRTVTYYSANVPLPAVVLSYPGPGYGDPDRPALSVLSAILSSGGSSRLYGSLVYGQKIAADASSSLDTMRLGGAVTLAAFMTGDHSIAEGEAALSVEVARLRSDPVPPEELAEAKNELIASVLRNRETAMDRASVLGYSIMMTDDPGYADGLIGRLARVSAEDVQRVARKYLADDQRVSIHYLPDSARPAGPAVANGRPDDGAAVIKLADLVQHAPAVTLAPPDARRPLPPLGPTVSIPAPTILSRTLPNGLRVVVVPSTRMPVVTAWMVLDGGAAKDPAGKAGLASVVANLLTTSTAGKSAPVLATAIERLGAVISADASHDYSSIYVNAPIGVFGQSLDLMTEILRRPGFAAADLADIRDQALDSLRIGRTEPGTAAVGVMRRLLFGAGRYGAPSGGTVESLPRVTRDDIVAFYGANWRPSTAVLVFAGDIKADQAFAMAERRFGDWQDAGSPATPLPLTPAARPSIAVIDQPGAGQAGVMAAMPAVSYTDKDYYPLNVASAILGGGTGSRLNQAIRVQRGLSYGASSSLFAGTEGGAFFAYAQTRNDAAAEVARLTVAQIATLSAAPVSQAELDARREPIIGDFARSLETADGLGGLVGAITFMGLPLDEIKDAEAKLRAVTPADVQAVARRYLTPDRTSLVLFGDARQFIGELRQAYPKVTVIPLDKLSLDGPIAP